MLSSAVILGLAVVNIFGTRLVIRSENPATRNHLYILAGMISASLVIEVVYRGISGRTLRLFRKTGMEKTPPTA
ncbi:MAG TPA: hypothetical protein DIW77_13295 [Chromatiaceae bacterium]|nr:MAG: hypothetical protein N838_04065 [Thiohalocapsa sp. PB-PSB1]HCS90974.1 hypothetical protein [Chromatiaceae bacterium]